MKALMEINTPTNNTPLSLQLYYYTIRAHIRGLAALGKTEDLLDTMLVHVILSSYLFIHCIRRKLARDHGNKEWIMK